MTDEKRHPRRHVRHSPQSITPGAQALHLSFNQTQVLFPHLDRPVGLARLVRDDTLRDGLAE